jgi:hypothetical protein
MSVYLWCKDNMPSVVDDDAVDIVEEYREKKV